MTCDRADDHERRAPSERRPNVDESTSTHRRRSATAVDAVHRHPVLRPHARAARQARRVRPADRGRGRPRDRHPPHDRGHRHRARDGAARRPRRQGRRPAVRVRALPARRGAGAGRARPLGTAVPHLRRRSRSPSGSAPSTRSSPRSSGAAFVQAAGITLHLRSLSGRNGHHVIEASFKGVARCLRDAVRVESDALPSTKGSL